MSTKPDIFIDLGVDTLHMCAQTNPKHGDFGYWLYDKTRGMNLAMKAKTERDAFVGALVYYQRRLAESEMQHKDLQSKVDAFVGQFAEPD